MLGVLGVGALIVGAIVAWRAESATTLLIVAAISQATVKTPTRMILAEGAKSWSFTSPANFWGARALAPGSYRVEWRSSGIPKIAKAEILAEDTFEWSAARLADYVPLLVAFAARAATDSSPFSGYS